MVDLLEARDKARQAVEAAERVFRAELERQFGSHPEWHDARTTAAAANALAARDAHSAAHAALIAAIGVRCG